MSVRWSPLLVPAEHGTWFFVLEPIVIGLLAAPSGAGAAITLAALLGATARQPLKIALADRTASHTYPRTKVASALAAALLATSLVALAIAVVLGRGSWWLPIIAAAPFVALQLAYDARRAGRGLVPELAGATAAAALAPTLVAADGWPVSTWLGLWALVAMKAVSATIYVRARLRLERGESVHATPPLAAHLVAVVAALWLAAERITPRLGAVAMTVLLVRAAWGLSGRQVPRRPQQIGFFEVGYGAGFALLTAAGYWFNA
jgi:hypothetical protein